jgi:uracil-DNA glycosylase
MHEKPNDPAFDSASDALSWLIAMGADEITLEQPVDRFAASLVADKPKALAPQVRATPEKEIAPSQALNCNSIAELTQALNYFESHPLRKSATQLSFFEGREDAEILIISDRPRNEEDRSGLVFAGKSRVLLENMLAAIDLKIHDVGMLNLVPWRPAGNASPTEAQIKLVLPFAQRALEILKPKFILAFSALPGQYLAGGDVSILRQRGKWQDVNGIQMLATLHPDELLKFPLHKKMAWRDLQIFRDGLQ